MLTTPSISARQMLAAALAIALAGACVEAATPTILFDSPRGGEVYAVGQVQKVRLGTKTRAKSVIIELSRDGGTTYEALGTINNTVKDVNLRNVLAFTVAGPASSNCVVRATGTVGKTTVTSVSSPFCIGSAGAPPAGSVTTASIANEAVSADKISSGSTFGNMVLTSDGSGGASFGPLPLDTRYVKAAGDTMTGLLTLSGDPTANLNAATKQYVDAKAGAANGVASSAGDSIVAALNDPATTTKVSGSVLTGTAGINITGNAATATSFTDALAGDVTGNQGTTKVVALQNRNVGNAAPAAGQALVWNNAASLWEPAGMAAIDITGNAATATLADSVADGCVSTTKIADGAVTNAKLATSSLTVTAGTGLSGGGAVSLGGSTTLNLANTAVTPGSYTRASITVDQQGRLTVASSGAAIGAADLEDGSVTVPKVDDFPKAQISRSTAQSIPDNTVTVLIFDTKSFDTDNCFDNTSPSRLTCHTAGTYIATVTLQFATGSDYRSVELFKNGTAGVGSDERLATAATSGTSVTVTTIVKLDAADYIEVRVRHKAGAALNVWIGNWLYPGGAFSLARLP